MSEKNNKSGAIITAPQKKKVAQLFIASKTKPYFLSAFCLYAKLTPDSEISETEFNTKLKEFCNKKLT